MKYDNLTLDQIVVVESFLNIHNEFEYVVTEDNGTYSIEIEWFDKLDKLMGLIK